MWALAKAPCREEPKGDKNPATARETVQYGSPASSRAHRSGTRSLQRHPGPPCLKWAPLARISSQDTPKPGKTPLHPLARVRASFPALLLEPVPSFSGLDCSAQSVTPFRLRALFPRSIPRFTLVFPLRRITTTSPHTDLIRLDRRSFAFCCENPETRNPLLTVPPLSVRPPGLHTSQFAHWFVLVQTSGHCAVPHHCPPPARRLLPPVRTQQPNHWLCLPHES
ncbi:hypothetical protein S7711_10795 [Stachybotrys chartarum IBT 7711]|uniref:Uncharacterized protein n=1 Tax=Stachybotrys chartarum (strain CBS 109288 / IBT 7711) TaxID=1280523 RepID=A0A084AR02_STACB|nr:hypothetical protein S7711_10795 [Stachybotrys chartarum IBT 7711]KFA54854.1 hypothetical protein S40293_10419 [Stachybotrys chartarum IBT 40293]KFA80779.1 hypothetical protein S40288_11043 [Stachybotrys chartarum IBT 40288]